MTDLSRHIAWSALLLACCGHPVSATQLPDGLAGTYVVASVVGDDPALLEVAKGSDLIGKTVTLTNDKLALWTLFAGHPAMVRATSGLLDTMLAVPESLRVQHDFPEAHRSLRFQQIGLDHCENDGQALPDCPVFVFAQDGTTGTLSLVTVPWGLAHLRRIN